jgi:ATP-dependent RNA helicase DeaD
MPHDWASMAHVLTPILDRLEDATREVQLLIVAADAEAAAAATAAIVRLVGSRPLDALAATSARRASRLLKLRPAQIVAGAPEELLALVQGSSLKLEHVRAVLLAWVDELIVGGEEPAFETLMAEIPKDAARIVVASAITPEMEELIERYARRARRVAPSTAEGAAVPLEYVTVSAVSRLSALRRLLDELDPADAVVYTRTDDSEFDVGGMLRALGYGGGVHGGNTSDAAAAAVRVTRAGGGAESELVVLYDIPASREELREAVGAQPKRVVALVQPRQLASLRALGSEDAITPLTLPEAGARARNREETVRAELRNVLESGAFSRELLTLEPLLERYDGIEIAAAALRLVNQARLERDALRTRSAAEVRAAQPPSMTRLFLNVGSMDNARPGDLVGAITNEAGITSAQLGKIDIRENHSLVEVAADVANTVVAKLTGTMIRGRRVIVRLDQERPARQSGGRPRPGSERERRDRGPSGEARSQGRPRRGEVDRGRREGGSRDRQGPARPIQPTAPERPVDRAARPPTTGETE